MLADRGDYNLSINTRVRPKLKLKDDDLIHKAVRDMYQL